MRRNRSLFVLGSVAVLCCAGMAFGDEVAQPWGTLHGSNSGAQSSDAASMLFSSGWSGGAQLAWEIDVRAHPDGLDRPATSGMSFDEDGNLYWKTSTGGGTGGDVRVASISPSGSVRWVGKQAGVVYGLGTFDRAVPVVGDGGGAGRVYCIGTHGGNDVVVAFSKSTGELVWETILTGANLNEAGTNGRLTPVLYGGKLYVLGQVIGGTGKVYQLDSTTGAVDWSSDVARDINCTGHVMMIPDVFGAGKHGLYLNGDSGTANDGVSDMYCILVDTTTSSAAQQWSADAGKVARSHVVYMPAKNRVCTHTWTDYGADMYCWNPDGTEYAKLNNVINSGHGFYDVGCLDFNGTDIIAGGFEGRFVRYADIPTLAGDAGPGYDDHGYYQTTPWFGEPRVFGGLYKDAAGKSILVCGTNSRDDLGPDHEARVIAVNVTDGILIGGCDTVEDGALYIDDFVMTSGPTTGLENTLINVAGFEGYTIGDLPGQDNVANGGTGTMTWDGSPYSSANGNVQIIADPTLTTTKVMKLDAYQGCGDLQGIFAQLPSATTDNVVVVRYKQFHVDLDDNNWLADAPSFDGWWAMGNWDTNAAQYPRQFSGGTPGQIPLTAGVWQQVEYKFDFVNGTVDLSIDAGTPTQDFLDIFGSETNMRGFTWELEATAFTRNIPPTPTIFEFNSGVVQNHGYTIRGGPQLAPTPAGGEQHICYFRADNGKAVAIKPAGPSCNTPAQDVDGDGDVDLADFSKFLSCFNGPNRPWPGPPVDQQACVCLNTDGDNDVDLADFSVFLSCFNGPSRPPAIACP